MSVAHDHGLTDDVVALLAVASDVTRIPLDRALAAASAWARAKEPSAATALEEVVGRLGALERLRVQQIAPDLIGALPAYYLHPRPDVLALIPPEAFDILEFGCAAGVLGHTVKSRQRCRYVGLELDPVAAAIAANTLDQVAVVDLDAGPLPFDGDSFDCVVCADVLEHIKDPWDALAQIFAILRPGGHLVVSIPNIRNLGVMAELAAGDWVYQDAGILDRTHLRFFTRRSFQRALVGAGFSIRSENCIVDPTLQAATTQTGSTLQVGCGQIQIGGLTFDDALELATIQFLFVGLRPVRQEVARPPSQLG